MEQKITQWLYEDESEDEEACDVTVPDLENDVEEDGTIDDFRAEIPDDNTEDSSSDDETPLGNYSSGKVSSITMGKTRKKLTKEEKVAKDRIRKREKYAQIKNNPELFSLQKEKEREEVLSEKREE
ncbi:hypothetical protein HF086_002966 [Spodoptera exigua]|uniref:Uncharacterized protein n=1 Tax=Spodoptera exigua TaxID=7107 RepID=A0A922MY58_SPOEX|nr:hypothetical protein HF086_002966 [Spodoptera exigua]